MIKIETHPNGYTSITGCSNCDEAPYLWFDNGEWMIDSDDGLFPAKYCPACGARLTPRAVDGATGWHKMDDGSMGSFDWMGDE